MTLGFLDTESFINTLLARAFMVFSDISTASMSLKSSLIPLGDLLLSVISRNSSKLKSEDLKGG